MSEFLQGLRETTHGLRQIAGSFRDRYLALTGQDSTPTPKPTDIEIANFLANLGYQNAVYTSCSIYRSIEDHMRRAGQIDMTKTTHEGNFGIAAGLAAGGRRVMVMLQNSGLFNAGDVIKTVMSPEVNDIPVLAFSSLRRDRVSEPHYAVGKVTSALAKILFPSDSIFGNEDGSDFMNELSRANDKVLSGHMALVLMPEEAFERTFEPSPRMRNQEDVEDILDQYDRQYELEREIAHKKGTRTETNPFPSNKLFDRFAAVQMVVEHYRKKDPRVRFPVSNGFNTRTIYSIYGADPSFLLLSGGMGQVAAITKGLAEARPDILFVGLNGNENNQMGANMNNHLKTEYPDNMEVVTFDDRAGSSVGGAESRPLTSDDFDFTRVIQTQATEYSPFVRDIGRITGSPELTRNFMRALREVPHGNPLTAQIK